MRLPLFSGLGSEEISQIIAQTKFQFQRLDTGKFLCQQDEKCSNLVILINGSMNIITHSADHGCIVSEPIVAPYLVSPTSLFGLHQRYMHSFQCTSTCRFVLLSKEEVFRMFDRYFIFKINWLNLLSTQVQKRNLQIWHTPPTDLRQRIVRFFLLHTEKPAGPKVFRIKMTRLAEEVNDSRLNVSRQLRAMEAQGVLTLQRGIITIPAFEKLLQTR
jgi:CRP-like cAMP-binding protein